MCSSDTSINYPAQPSYGEGMADALKAQVQLLTGTGDFKETGSLESLLPLEESIRKKTAQTDTDILRQTLLGSGSDEKYAPDGRIITGYQDPPAQTGGLKVVNDISYTDADGKARYLTIENPNANDFQNAGGIAYYTMETSIVDTSTGKIIENKTKTGNVYKEPMPDVVRNQLSALDSITPQQRQALLDADYPDSLVFGQGGQVTEATPIYKKDASGNDVVAPEGSFTPGQSTQRAGDGMIDLLGDTRNITQYETRTASQADVDAGLADEVGKQFVQKIDATDQAGFRDGEFKGLSAMAEDIQRGNLSRQREADLQDVARLEPLFGQIMEDYKPGTTSALTGAKDLIEEQKDNLLGDVGITVPTESTYSGDLDRQSLEAGTSYKPSASVQGGTYTGELGVGNDALRGALLADAKQALGQGLTDREERQIAEASRARSTMMGRTFDQSGAIAEAQARVAEDNQRKMQNRGFAQKALGQEASLQEADLGRGMQAQLTNQQATNQALQAGMAAGLGQEQAQAQLAQAAGLAEQGQKQQAAQFGVASQMDAEKLRESLRQQGLLGYLDAASRVSQLENQGQLDPFQAILGRSGGGSLQAGQSVFGQAGYGLNSGPAYLNPESGLGYIQNQATNAANMYGAQVAADATRSAGLMSGLGALGGGIGGGMIAKYCWVAREVYGEHNPAWLLFRKWMLNDSPSLFRKAYIKYGERFASFISDKPRLKARIRTWMDSKIGR